MRFSVIVPVYNCIKELRSCVDSILQQTCSDFELLLIDDGSNDGSRDQCDQLAAQDSRIRVFHKANGGASSARNLGLKQANGDYILFIDGDDTVEPDLLEQVSLIISSSPAQMVIFGMAFDSYSASGRLEKTELFSIRHRGCFSSEHILSSFSAFFDDNALSSACNKVFSGGILRETGLLFSEDMTLYEDLDLVLRYLPYCKQVACIDRAFYHYRLSLQAPHVNNRVMDLEGLQRNLKLLCSSVLSLNAPNVSQKTADLCAQLFDMHLMTASYSRGELNKAVHIIQESAALRSLACHGISPSPSASPSWALICEGAVSELYVSLKKRKLFKKIKGIIKPVLQKIGFFHCFAL